MANYRLVSNAMFRPFSFEEYVKPYLMYGEAYKEMEMNIADLEEKAGKWDKLANELSDPKTHATYKAYADELRALADLLSRYGMSPLLRRRAAVMRGRYAKDIEPIETLYNKREQLRLEQHLLNVASHGTLRFDNDYSKMSLDTMLENPNMTYDFVSGELITNDVMNEVIAKAKGQGIKISMDDPDNPSLNKRGESVYKVANKTSGYTLQQVEDVIAGRGGPLELVDIYDEVAKSYKNRPAFDAEWAKPYIDRGIRAGVLGQEANLMQDVNVWTNPELEKFGESVRQFNTKLAEDKRQFNATMAQRRKEHNDSVAIQWALIRALRENRAIDLAFKNLLSIATTGCKVDKKGNLVKASPEEIKAITTKNNYAVDLTKRGPITIDIIRGDKISKTDNKGNKVTGYKRTYVNSSLMTHELAAKFIETHPGKMYSLQPDPSNGIRSGIEALESTTRAEVIKLINGLSLGGTNAEQFYYYVSDDYFKDSKTGKYKKVIFAFPYTWDKMPALTLEY